MKIIFIALILTFSLSFAKISFSLNSFSADFKQTIINDMDNKVVYLGHIKLKKPFYAKWEYLKPLKKTVYTNQNEIKIVDDVLEQMNVVSVNNKIDILSLLKELNKVNSSFYKGKYSGIEFFVYFKNDLISKIQYKDGSDNNITIEFKNQKNNLKIKNSEFKAIYPKYYDVVK
jgi:outer membrane lipoprotein carrier protein